MTFVGCSLSQAGLCIRAQPGDRSLTVTSSSSTGIDSTEHERAEEALQECGFRDYPDSAQVFGEMATEEGEHRQESDQAEKGGAQPGPSRAQVARPAAARGFAAGRLGVLAEQPPAQDAPEPEAPNRPHDSPEPTATRQSIRKFARRFTTCASSMLRAPPLCEQMCEPR